MKCPTASEKKKIIIKKLPKNLMKTETFFLEKSSIDIHISLILDMAWTLCCVEC